MHITTRFICLLCLCLCCIDGKALTKNLPKETPKKVAAIKRAKPQSALNSAMEKYLQAAADQKLNIHSVMVLQHGKVLYEKWLNGGEAEKPHILNSVSKTFTSAAVGLAIGEGLLSLDDKLVSFFPDDLPAGPSDNLK